jgi:ureidoglycolate hydrolase
MRQDNIEIVELQEEGYKPLVDFETWRVAVLKYCNDVRLENIKTMQRHQETDEVFVLLKGNCTLISGGNGEEIDKIETVKMEPNRIYNVKKGVWHNHILDEEGEVLIVENQNTCDDNSPVVELSKEERNKMRDVIKA